MSTKFTKILRKARFAMLNYGLIQSVGLNAACLLGVLAWKCPEHDDEFPLDTDKIDRMLKMGHSARRKAEDRLIVAGLIEKSLKGQPARNYYRIHGSVIDDLLDGMLPKGGALDRPKRKVSPSSLEGQSDQTGSSGNPATDGGETTSVENAAIKNKSNNTRKKYTPPSGVSDTGKEKDRGSEGEPASTSTTASDPKDVGLGAASKIDSTGGRIALAQVSGAGAADPLLKKDGTPRKDARERAFIGYFIEEFTKAHGCKPILDANGGKNTVLARTILKKMEGKSEELARIVQRYVQNQDPFYAEKGWTLSILASDSVLQQHSDMAWAAKKKAPMRVGSTTIGRRLD